MNEIMGSVIPSLIFLFGLSVGFIANKIVPIEYKFYRRKQREEENEINQWYNETLPIINKLAIKCLQLWLNQKQNPKDAESHIGIRLGEYKNTDVYQDIEELSEEFLDQLYGAPKDLDINLTSIDGTDPQSLSVSLGKVVADETAEITSRQLYDLMRVAVEVNQRAAERTGRHTSGIVNQELMELIESELSNSTDKYG
ncbi:hypothetical protein LPA44_13055 [Halobacterium sp. KA-4]|nr:hypothetical protein [Halobacterium sp. KA-4]